MKRYSKMLFVFILVGVVFLTGCGPTLPTNTAPVIANSSPGSPLSVQGGESKIFSVTATDADGDNLTYIWSKTAGEWTAENGNQVTWKAPNAEGTAQITVKVSDGKASSTQTWNITINGASDNQKPVITKSEPSSPVTVEVSKTQIFNVTAQDLDGDTLTYTWTSGNIGTFNNTTNNQVTWTAPAQAGSTTVKVVVSDGKEQVEKTWAVTIKPKSSVVEISQDISTPTTFETGKTYVFLDDISISARLTIQPGVIIKVSDGCGIDVTEPGSIIASGTLAQPIIFTSIHDDLHGGDTNGDGSLTSPNPENWDSIYLYWAKDSSFSFCHFLYGGGGAATDATVTVNETEATFDNCIFAYNNGEENGALDLSGAYHGSHVKYSTFYSNVKPLTIDPILSVDESNWFHNPNDSKATNEMNSIFIERYYGEITENVTWAETEVPFVIYDEIRILDHKVLTLSPGVVIKFGPDAGFSAETGSIKANGTESTPIYFTSINDDTVLGDTLNDFDTVGPYPGDWGSIILDESSLNANSFTYCYFRYGGGRHTWDDVLRVRYTNASLNNCFFENSNGATSGALNLAEAQSMSLSTCSFIGNEIPVVINTKISTENTNFFAKSNTKNGIFLDEYQYDFEDSIKWLETSVPYVIQNDVEIYEDARLTLGSGVIVKVRRDCGIFPYGNNLVRSGTAIFTAYTDDSNGGDTNGDGYSEGSKGYWTGIFDNLEDEYMTWSGILFAAN